MIIVSQAWEDNIFPGSSIGMEMWTWGMPVVGRKILMRLQVLTTSKQTVNNTAETKYFLR